MTHRILRHERVDSTSERAFEALHEGSARDGDVHVASEQTAGRGRLGARWSSAPGAGLYASLVLLPRSPLPHPAAITMSAGLCVLAALIDLGARQVRLKWPNDLLVGAAKLAGILVETRGLDPSAPHCVVGIGINVTQERFPDELTAQRPVTSLKQGGVETTPELVLERVLAHWDPHWDRALTDPEGVATDYWRTLGFGETRVRVDDGKARHEGVALEFSLASGVTLETGAGRVSIAVERVRAITAL